MHGSVRTRAPRGCGTQRSLPASRTSGHTLCVSPRPPLSGWLWVGLGLSPLGDRQQCNPGPQCVRRNRGHSRSHGAFRNHASSRVPMLVFEKASVTAGQQAMSAEHDLGPEWAQPRGGELCLWHGDKCCGRLCGAPRPGAVSVGNSSAHLPSTWEPPPWRPCPVPRHKGAHHRRLTHRQGQARGLQGSTLQSPLP